MGIIAVNSLSAPYRAMSLTSSPEKAEQRLIGEALRRLREQKGKLQREVAEGLGVKTQAWSYYENGERRFTQDRVAAVLKILGVTDGEFAAAKAHALGAPPRRGFEEPRIPFVFDVYGRARAGPQGPEIYDVAEPLRQLDLRQMLGPTVDALEVAGDSMSPWADSGEVVLFDRERAPRRGKGCVIELHSGEAYVKLYEKSDGSTLFVRELSPEERTITFALREVKGVYPAILRGD